MKPVERQILFLEMASRAGGSTAQEVYEVAQSKGDTATIEAYHNLGRRLEHRGILTKEKDDRQTRYLASQNVDLQWLDEEQLAAIVDPDYPLIALTAAKELVRQLHEVPEEVWLEIRERLKTVPARKLFLDGIMAYSDALVDELQNCLHESGSENNPHLAHAKRESRNALMTLRQITKFGLGLSDKAIHVPQTLEAGLAKVRQMREGDKLYDARQLEAEIQSRVANEPVIVDVSIAMSNPDLLVAAVDGSTRGGLLSFQGEESEVAVGYAPMFSINTATAEVNRKIKISGKVFPAFLRLPEKPEDMQRDENRYTVMAKLFFPDLSDVQYAHSVWNAMDLLESKACLRVMKRWLAGKGAVEVRPADVVLRDGTAIPQDRDFSHYMAQDSYGRIVRDAIETSWEIAKKIQEDQQVVAGVVKNAQLKILSPLINHYICKMAAENQNNSQVKAWPLAQMNLLPDQTLLTRILTEGRKKGDKWTRTCIMIRPFYASTNLGEGPLTAKDNILTRKSSELASSYPLGEQQRTFWNEFREERDPYMQMVEKVSYASFFLGSVPRLDSQKVLPRFEFVVFGKSDPGAGFPDTVDPQLQTLLSALDQMGFEVSDEHSMFVGPSKLDILPVLLIRVHDTVKLWATELLARVQEYIGYQISSYTHTGVRGIRVRQWRRPDLQRWVERMQLDRNRQAGELADDGKKLSE